MKGLKSFQHIAFFCFITFTISCSPQPFDPDKEIRIFYEYPMGCDEVSGVITLKASVTGENAPVPAQIQYEIRESLDSEPVIFKGYAPDYEVLFDSTSVRDGFVYYRAVPMDEHENPIDIKAFPCNAKGIIPSFKGFMVNNGQISLTQPLVIMGAPLEPELGEIDENNFEEKLSDSLIFGASLMTHLQSLGFIPEFCFEDHTTVVIDPFNPSTGIMDFPKNPFDLMGQSVGEYVRWNPGNLCNPSPFFESPLPNGIPDIWQYTAIDYLMLQHELGSVRSKPDAINFFYETIERLTIDYSILSDWFSIFELEKPVAWSEPEDIVKKKLKQHINAGASSVLIYDFYNKANEFEMSSGSWPHIQRSLDKVNDELGTNVKLGTIAANHNQLMDYEGFYRSLFLSVREIVSASYIADDKKVGIIIAAHGSSTTNRLYDVSNIINNPIMEERIEDYFKYRKSSIHVSVPDILVCYSEYANKPEDGLRGVGEQVRDWVNEHYDYVFVFPMEWPWAGMDLWDELRANAVELLEGGVVEIFTRDEKGRSKAVINNTTLVIGETIFDQKDYNPSAYHFLRAAATNLLEDRMIELTGSEKPKEAVCEFSITAPFFSYMFQSSENIVMGEGKITFQNSGIRAETTQSNGKFTGTVDRNDFHNYLFFVLVDFGIVPANLSVNRVDIAYSIEDELPKGKIEAEAETYIFDSLQTMSISITF